MIVEVAEGAALIYTAYWLAHDVQPEIQDELLMLQDSDGLLKQANQKAATRARRPREAPRQRGGV